MKKLLLTGTFFLIVLMVLAGCGGGSGGGGTSTYTVAYNDNGCTSGFVPIDNTNYQPGQTVMVLDNTGQLAKTGFNFTGWNTKADGSGITYTQGQAFTMGTSNVTMYAKWTTNPTYTVTYNGNGNTGGSVPVDNTNYEQGQTVTILGNTGNLVKTGYSFTGWNTQADGSGTTYTQGQTFTMDTSNVTLYAMWAQIKIAYIYDSVDSPACATITSLLSDYSLTQIPHNAVEITTASLSSYALIIIAYQANSWDYNQNLANTIINAGNPIIAMGETGSYFYLNQNVLSLPGLAMCGSGDGLTQVTPVDSSNPIWTTPNTITGNPVTVFGIGQSYFAVTKPNWPDGFTTNGISIGTNGNASWHILARESDKYFLWGLCGSIDDLNATGKNLFVNAVHYMLNH